MVNIKIEKMELKGDILICIAEGDFESAIQILHKYNDLIVAYNEISFKDRFFYYYNMIKCFRGLNMLDMAKDYLTILDFIISNGYMAVNKHYNAEMVMFNELKEDILSRVG